MNNEMEISKGIAKRLPSLPRVSDEGQRRALGNIIRFFAALLILTLIARGTGGATLARVEIKNPSRGEIIEAVAGTATVSARDTLELTVPEGLTISELMIGTGQRLKLGDTVAQFELSELEELLVRENANLDKLVLDMEKLERGEDVDSIAMETARRILARVQEDYEAVRAKAEADVAEAWEELNEARAASADEVDTAALDTARRNLERAREDYNAAAKTDSSVMSAQNGLNQAQNSEAAKRSAWENAAQADKDAALAAYQAAQNETEKARLSLESAQEKASDSLLAAKRKLEDAETALAKAEKDYAEALEDASEAVQDAIEKAEAALESAQDKANDDLLAALRKVEDAKTALDKARDDYGKNAQNAADTAAQNGISAASLALDIDEQQATVDEILTLIADGGVLYAQLEGIVSTVAAKGSTTNSSALVTLQDSASGFEAQFSVDYSDAERLAVGDSCQVTTGGGSMYYNPTVTGTISAISAPDENDMTSITVLLPGADWTSGQRVDVEAVLNRDSYDLCVPLSALRSDSTGYYLLTVEQKSTVLGVENIVVRTPVTVSASDDDQAAVKGPIDRSSKVITSSNKTVAAGDRVREKEE